MLVERFGNSKETMLVVDNISIRFGDERVLDHFSCHVKKGDFACITGKSGCGKTSLLKAFIGLTPLVNGCIRVGEYSLNEQTCNIVRTKTMYLPQELSFPNDTVEELVGQTIKIGRLKNGHTYTYMLHNNLHKLGLESELLCKRIAEISGGQRQRLMLAVLALLNKDIWLLDEPTAALDETSRNYVIDFLREQQQRGKTIVAVSHDMYFVSHCNNVINLE